MPFAVKIKSTIINTLQVAIFGFNSDFRMDLDPGPEQTANAAFDPGHYMVVAWDIISPNHPLVASAHVHMLGKTLLTVKPNGITAITPVDE